MLEVQSWETVPRQPEDPPLTSLRLIIWFKCPLPPPRLRLVTTGEETEDQEPAHSHTGNQTHGGQGQISF